MLTDPCELLDWRRFLLSAALPWPFPSLTELLLVLQRFKAADNGNTGYINEEQYLQVSLYCRLYRLWFLQNYLRHLCCKFRFSGRWSDFLITLSPILDKPVSSSYLSTHTHPWPLFL